MQKPILLCLSVLILLFCTSCSQKQDLQAFLNNIQGAKIEHIEYDDSTRETYKIMFRQRIDRFGKDTATFLQKIFLSHLDFSKPVVIVTEGYNIKENRISEPAKILDANQIIIEHRYFGESVPDSLNWKFLNIKQAAEDDHVIVQLFKELYKTKWVSTGISKGGQTALFYKYYYPNDVDATIAYVAPIVFDRKDSRIFTFLSQVGSDSCRQKVINFQKLLLKNKKELLPIFEKYAKENDMTFKLGYESAFEYCVLEFSFSFWQWGDLDCDSIPTSSKDLNLVFKAFSDVGFSFFSEEEINEIRPFYYQALTELGFYYYDIKPFGKLIEKVKDPNFYFAFPKGADTTYNFKIMKDVNIFLQTQGNNIIYIYGEYDPWSAPAVQLIPGKTKALKMLKKSGNHRTRIKSFDDDDREKIYKKLEEWLNCKIKKL
jgi:hypothetical protein